MANVTPYSYKANTSESYDSLAAYVVNTSLNASFFPKALTIVVIPDEEENDFKEVGRFIDTEGLNFHITPIIPDEANQKDLIESEVTPSCILQAFIYKMLAENAQKAEVVNSLQTRLEVCESNLAKAQKDRDNYYKWWQEEESKRTRLVDTIKALRTLLNSVVE